MFVIRATLNDDTALPCPGVYLRTSITNSIGSPLPRYIRLPRSLPRESLFLPVEGYMRGAINFASVKKEQGALDECVSSVVEANLGLYGVYLRDANSEANQVDLCYLQRNN